MKLKKRKNKKATGLEMKIVMFAIALIFLVILSLVFPTKLWAKAKEFFDIFNFGNEKNKTKEIEKTFQIQQDLQKAINDCLRKNDNDCYCSADLPILNPDYLLVLDNKEGKMYIENKESKKIVSKKMNLPAKACLMTGKDWRTKLIKLNNEFCIDDKMILQFDYRDKTYVPSVNYKTSTVVAFDMLIDKIIIKDNKFFFYIEAADSFKNVYNSDNYDKKADEIIEKNLDIKKCKSKAEKDKEAEEAFNNILGSIEKCKSKKGNLCYCDLNIKEFEEEYKIIIKDNKKAVLEYSSNKGNENIKSTDISTDVCFIESQLSAPNSHTVVAGTEMSIFYKNNKAYLSVGKNKDLFLGTDKLIKYNYKGKEYVCFYNDAMESQKIAKYAKRCES